MGLYMFVVFFPGGRQPEQLRSLLCNNRNNGPIAGTLNNNETKVIVGTYCCSRMTSDDISARMAYVMWHEEHLWNVSVLQRVQYIFTNLYCYTLILFLVLGIWGGGGTNIISGLLNCISVSVISVWSQ
jgi:hypothetical protein